VSNAEEEQRAGWEEQEKTAGVKCVSGEEKELNNTGGYVSQTPSYILYISTKCSLFLDFRRPMKKRDVPG
jgi:hypothetical protein